jgi:hypothetical protein
VEVDRIDEVLFIPESAGGVLLRSISSCHIRSTSDFEGAGTGARVAADMRPRLELASAGQPAWRAQVLGPKPGLGQGPTTVSVLVQQPPVKPEVKMKDFLSWLGNIEVRDMIPEGRVEYYGCEIARVELLKARLLRSSNDLVLENPLPGAFDELKTVALPWSIGCLNAGLPDLADERRPVI